MVKIRLMRVGSKKNANYRLVVVDSRVKRSGDYIESLGHYDPTGRIAEPLVINAERASHWLSQGAQPTETALKLLEQAGVSTGNVAVKRKKSYTARIEAAKA
ncbi:MAG: 30S ribosomal protein S16 [Deinococcales bacterium]